MPWHTRWTITDASHGQQSRISPTARRTHTKGKSFDPIFWWNFNWVFHLIHCSSVSLTSLDSEEQESLRANERIHNRTNRNSTGGISTHSLNEAELAVSCQMQHHLNACSRHHFRETLRSWTRSEILRPPFVASHYKNPSRRHQSHPFKMPKKKTTYRELINYVN
jgi:hypothetical protein